MTPTSMTHLIWAGGATQAAIIVANAPLPGRLAVRRNLAGTPGFIRQMFYVHWVYILLVLGLFSALCLGFAPGRAGGSRLGRFLSAFLAGFWLLRIVLQVFYYDPEVRRANRLLDTLYRVGLAVLVIIFGWAGFKPAL